MNSARNRIILLSLLLCYTTLVLSQAQREADFSELVSQGRLLRQVRELVRIGARTGGTKSGDQAAAYLARQFILNGYSPTISEDPKRLAYQLKTWDLQARSPKRLRDSIRNAWVGAYSPTVPKTEAAVVYEDNPDEMDYADLEGKAVLLDNPISDRTYRQIEKAGARCLLVISPEVEGAYSDWAMIHDLPASSQNLIQLFNLSRNNGRTLKSALRDSQNVVLSFFVKSAIDSGRPKTVLARLEGKSKKYYLVCAHGDSDSGGPGADDNASGVSAVLETARILQRMIATGKLPPPTYSIVFGVWGSEMFSSGHYVRQEAERLGDIVGVVNLDEVGTGATRDCIYFESNEVEYNSTMLRTFERIGEEYAGKKGFWAEATTNPSQGGTDSYVFFPRYLQRLKLPEVMIPSMTMYTGAWNELKAVPQTPGWSSKAWKGHPDTVYVDYSAYYHSSLDVPERTTEREPFNMVGAVKALGIGLLRLAW